MLTARRPTPTKSPNLMLNDFPSCIFRRDLGLRQWSQVAGLTASDISKPECDDVSLPYWLAGLYLAVNGSIDYFCR